MYVFSYILYSIEDVHNGLKYVLYTKQYYYEAAEAKYADNGGTLAMATDTEIFDVLMVRATHVGSQWNALGLGIVSRLSFT